MIKNHRRCGISPDPTSTDQGLSQEFSLTIFLKKHPLLFLLYGDVCYNYMYLQNNPSTLSGSNFSRCALLVGVRSVSFRENIVTIGTGMGTILFYDLNAGKYLQCSCGHICLLRAGPGYLVCNFTSQLR